jgi:DNA helicase HerA-like ATPase
MTVFAKSGSGKSFAVKLEILRSLMMGVDVIVIDPENEYQALINQVG